MTQIHAEARLDRQMMKLLIQLNSYLRHFPRFERYGLTQQIREAAYDTYSLIIAAQKPYSRKTTLANLDVRHEQLRMLIRLAGELDYFSWREGRQPTTENTKTINAFRRVQVLDLMVDEVGRMIGGWMKHYKDKGSSKC